MCLSLLSCCICVSLEVGVKIISILSLVSSSLISLTYGMAAMMPTPVLETRKVIYASVASVSMFQVLIGVLLVYGVFWRKHRWMVPWLATSWVSSILLLFLAVLGAILVITQNTGDAETSAEVSTMVSVYFVYAVLLYYFTSVVNSMREVMLREDSTESSQRLMRQRDYLKTAPV